MKNVAGTRTDKVRFEDHNEVRTMIAGGHIVDCTTTEDHIAEDRTQDRTILTVIHMVTIVESITWTMRNWTL